MFRKALKKRQRLICLRKLLGNITFGERCLLLTCGDNNGAMNYYLRELGGDWSWADLEDCSLAEMAELLGEPVIQVQEDRLPFPNGAFDRVVSIDVHEHVDNPEVVNQEICRILRPGGQLIVTTPNGDETKLAVKLKNAVGMSKETYGHRRVGLTAKEIEILLNDNGVAPRRSLTFSRFFTEVLELTINYTYVKFLSRKSRTDMGHHEIAPATAGQFRTVSRSYRIYSIIFPLYWILSKLDWLILFTEGYCVMVEGRRRA